MKSSSNLIHFSLSKKENNNYLSIKNNALQDNNNQSAMPLMQNFLQSNLNNIKDELNNKFLKFQTDITLKIENSKQSSAKIDNQYLLNLITEQKVNYEKIPEILQKLEKIEDKLNIIDISSSALRLEFDKACLKYDDIFINNLQVPGKIGLGCKYKNLREFFFSIFDNMKDLNTFKEQCLKELKSKQEKIDKVFELSKKEIEGMKQSNLLYLTRNIDPFEKKLEENLVDINRKIDKLNNDYIENSNNTKNLENEMKKICRNIDLINMERNDDSPKLLNEKIKRFLEIRNHNFKINNEFSNKKNKLPSISKKLTKSVETIKHRNSFDRRVSSFIDLEETKKPQNNILRSSLQMQMPNKNILNSLENENKININQKKNNQKIDNFDLNTFEDNSIIHSLSIVNKNRRYYMDGNETNSKEKEKCLENLRKNQKTTSVSSNNVQYVDVKETIEEIEDNKNNINSQLSSIKGELNDNKRYEKNELLTDNNIKNRGKTNIHINDVTNNFFINNSNRNINTISNQSNINRKVKLRKLTKNQTEQNLKTKLLPNIFKNERNNTIAYKDLVVSFFGEKEQIRRISEKKFSGKIKKKHKISKEKNENIIQNYAGYDISTLVIENDQNKYKKQKQIKNNLSMEKIPFSFKKTTKMQYKKNK